MATLRAPKDDHSKPERVGIRCRWAQGNVEYALLEDGHYWVFRTGDLVPGAPVRVRGGWFDGRRGQVQALIPTWAGQIRAAVQLERRPRERRRPLVFLRPEDLVVERR